MGTVRNGVYYSKHKGDEIDNLLDKTVWHSNPNLLDNWYFVGGGSQQGGGQFPINQRGQTSYSGGSYTYGIDRWKTFSYAVPLELTQAGIYIAKTTSSFVMHQVYSSPLIIGEKYTLSMLTSGGLYKYTFNAPSSGDISSGRILTSRTRAQFWFSGESQTDVTLIACKLELGDTQTLAHQENGVWVLNEIPNYQEQLARCQRYQEASSAFTYQVNGDGTFDFSVPFKVAKRNSGFPVTVYSNAGTPNAVSVWTSNGWADIPIQSPVSGDYVTREDSFRLIVTNAGAYAIIEFHFFADNNL